MNSAEIVVGEVNAVRGPLVLPLFAERIRYRFAAQLRTDGLRGGVHEGDAGEGGVVEYAIGRGGVCARTESLGVAQAQIETAFPIWAQRPNWISYPIAK